MKPLLFLVVLSLLSLAACKKVVDLHLHNVSPYYVIEGEVTDQPGPYTVSIHQSVNFGADNTFPGISGASVVIADDQGVADTLTETAPGIYTTHIIQGTSGNTYTMSAKINDTLYSAVSTMPDAVPFDSITYSARSAFGNDRIYAQPNFQDPPGIENNYQFIEYLNGKQIKNIFVLDDRLSDGKYITRNLRNDSTYMVKGDELEIKMYCIDRNIYNYFYQLDQSIGTNAFNTTAAPANPATNISNGVLGYFSAHTVRSLTSTVEY